MVLNCGHPTECRYSFLEKGVRKIYCFACIINATGVKPVNVVSDKVVSSPKAESTEQVEKPKKGK